MPRRMLREAGVNLVGLLHIDHGNGHRLAEPRPGCVQPLQPPCGKGDLGARANSLTRHGLANARTTAQHQHALA